MVLTNVEDYVEEGVQGYPTPILFRPAIDAKTEVQ